MTFQYKENDRVATTQTSPVMRGTVIWVASCERLHGEHPDDCQIVRIMWDAGNGQTFHANSDQIALKHRGPTSTAGPQESDMPAEAFDVPEKASDVPEELKGHESDFAYNVYLEALSRARDPWWKVYDQLGPQPYLVIGDFAYLLGYDGSYYQVPVKYVKGDNPNNEDEDEYVFTVMWREAVEVAETMAPYLSRLMNVISDMGNIRDIMGQSGVVVGTPKLCYRGELDKGVN